MVNLILAVVFVGVSIAIGMVGKAVAADSVPLALLQYMALIGINLNLLLAFFNLIPIPPLDGSHLLYHALPPGLGARYRALSGYGLLILPLLLFMTPQVFSLLLYPARALASIAMGFVAPYALEGLPGL